MQRPFRSFRYSSFTIVELLVVLGIIAIMAAVIVGVSNELILKAQRVKAANTANSIQGACMAYDTEYGVYPVTNGTTTDTLITDVAASSNSWSGLIYALSGNLHPTTGLSTPTPSVVVPNTRSIAFLTLKPTDLSGDAPKNPLPSGTTLTEIFFNIAMDSDYDGALGTTVPTSTAMPNFATGTTTSLSLSGGSTTAGVAVWANCSGNTTTSNANFWVHTY